MDYVRVVFELYETFFDSSSTNSIDNDNVRDAIERMKEAYKPKNRDSESDNFVDYNNFTFQHAYLHKYARLHTALACEALEMFFKDTYVFHSVRSKKRLNLCSLGGGPGTDIFALLFAIENVFGGMQCNVDVIDCAAGWKFVFDRLLLRMVLSFCDKSRPLPSWTQNYKYLCGDLLLLPEVISPDVYDALKNADILTMIKFISSVNFSKARNMIKAVFCLMKQHSFLFYIDNAAGGFHELVAEVAEECKDWGIISVFGPVKNFTYRDPRLCVKLHGYNSQYKSIVTIRAWKKMKVSNHAIKIVSPEIIPIQTELPNLKSEP